jgi:type IV pilus assembly protein PilA
MRKHKGFSLIELLIVVAIILIIAAIAIPNLLRARMAANESSAASAIRTINTAQVSYLSAYPGTGYASSLPSLGQAAAGTCPTPTSTNACLIDFSLSNATAAAQKKSGYWYLSSVNGAGNTGYTVGGVPSVFNQSGVKSFCSNEDSVIRAITTSLAAPMTVSATCATAPWTAIQ